VTLGVGDLQALAHKYRTLVALRARRDAGGAAAPPPSDRDTMAALRELAREFPGCLRELDTLGAAELARRAAAAEAAAAGAPPEPWMAWIDGYHRLMRAAFEIRRRQRSPEEVAALDAPEGPAAAEMDPAFVQAVVKPPLGRIGIVVLRRLAVLFDVPARDIAAALFPLRRPSPYKL
jgi:hypothetical protein